MDVLVIIVGSLAPVAIVLGLVLLFAGLRRRKR